MNKLSRKDIAMLEVLAVTEESKGKLAEYIQQREKAAKAYKAFREAVVNGVEVEKVEQKGNKFEAGDKALILMVTDELNARKGFFIGDEVTVTGYRDGIVWKVSEDGANVIVRAHDNIGFFREEELELAVEGKPSNELRAEVIQRAKEFVEKHRNITAVKLKGKNRMVDIDYIVNAEKRAVVVLLKCALDNKVMVKGIAKCNPSDVFNEHIGKAIALGRVLGKDVSEFENAAQPDEVVVGHVVNGDEAVGLYSQEHKFTLTSKRGCDAFYYAENEEDFIYNWQIGDIVDDTNAIYGECVE